MNTTTTLVNMFFKETSNGSLKAELCRNDNSVYFVRYRINEDLVKVEEYPGKSLYFVEDAIQNWFSGVKALNG